MEFKEKIVKLQNELKAPKSQFNKFGNYKYRSCEDILEAVKPLLEKYKLVLNIKDELNLVGERYYIKAIARIEDCESDLMIENTAYAREEEQKKGMDGSQITGTASSYARKYCLNGLFLIDDTKDADTDEYHKEINKTKEIPKDKVDNYYKQELIKFCKEKNIDLKEIAKEFKLNSKTANDEFKKVYERLVENKNDEELK